MKRTIVDDDPMKDTREADGLLVDPRRLLLDMAQQRSASELLWLIVRRLCETSSVAMARIWLIRPGQGCPSCPMRAECPSQTKCLHLVASAGTSVACPGVSFSRIDGSFRRFPLGIRKVGQIAATGEPVEAPDLASLPDWIVRPAWVQAEGIKGFGGQPLVSRGNVLGVLGIFSRVTIDATSLDWLRMIADHAASALANALAWEEIAALKRRLELDNAYLQEEVRGGGSFGDMVGKSAALDMVSRQIQLVAPTDAMVLLQGESGTGKELVAREIHRRSQRAERPLIKVNCAAIPRELFDSEFFGHRRGGFTGAVRDRMGRFELADGGTLFLDEIGEIPIDLQSKLLRVLQEGELTRIGEEKTRTVNVRIIAATHRDLRAESAAGRFRTDLYYRLSVFPIAIPPLRQRKEDIPLLVEYFLKQISRRLGRSIPRVTKTTLAELVAYDWPGNIRELQHVIERGIIVAEGGFLHVELASSQRNSGIPTPVENAVSEILTDAQLRALEADNISCALRKTGGKIYGPSGAAQLLGLKPTTLASRMKRLGISG